LVWVELVGLTTFTKLPTFRGQDGKDVKVKWTKDRIDEKNGEEETYVSNG